MAANSTENDDRTVEISTGLTFSSMPIQVQNVTNITFVIDGTLKASKDHEHYPTDSNSASISNFLVLYDTEHITFKGQGAIDGQGFMWWVREFLKKNPNGRPFLIQIRRTRYLDFSGVKLLNSPHFHLSAKDID